MKFGGGRRRTRRAAEEGGPGDEAAASPFRGLFMKSLGQRSRIIAGLARPTPRAVVKREASAADIQREAKSCVNRRHMRAPNRASLRQCLTC